MTIRKAGTGNSASEKPRLAILVLSYNELDDTSECLESLLQLEDCDFRIILIDNASTDGSDKLLQDRFPGVMIVRTPANMGFAGGMNAGIRVAVRYDPDYLFLLNNDAVVEPGLISEVLSFADNNGEVGVIGPRIVRYSEPGNNQFSWQDNAKGLFDTIALSGSAFFVRLRTFREVGLLDESFFMYWEEKDFFERCRRRGFRVVYLPTRARVLHKVEATVSKTPGLLDYYLTRNGFVFIRRYGGLRMLLGHVILSVGTLASPNRSMSSRLRRLAALRDGLILFVRNTPAVQPMLERTRDDAA